MKNNLLGQIVLFVFSGSIAFAENSIPKNKVLEDLLNCQYPIGVVLASEIATSPIEFSYYDMGDVVFVHVPYNQMYNESVTECSALLIYPKNSSLADTIIAVPYSFERIEDSQFFISKDEYCSTIGECYYIMKVFNVKSNRLNVLNEINYYDKSVLFDGWINLNENWKLKPYIDKEVSRNYNVKNYIWRQGNLIGLNIEIDVYILRFTDASGYSIQKQVSMQEHMFK